MISVQMTYEHAVNILAFTDNSDITLWQHL